MTDLADKLVKENIEGLETRRRNASRIATREPGTPHGAEAERHLTLIEAEFDRRYLPGAMRTFLEEFPLGFDDPKHHDQERRYKVRASEYCREHLTPAAFAEVASGGSTDGLLSHVRILVGMTNLIQGSFEKPKLLDAISDAANTSTFLNALGRLLGGNGDPAARLGDFTATLDGLGLRKWTYTTYFLFLSDPTHCMFVKPDGLKRAIEITRYPLEYESSPSAQRYSEILAFARWLWAKLDQQGMPSLKPRDMIDVQSFIWHMAPTGKFAI